MRLKKPSVAGVVFIWVLLTSACTTFPSGPSNNRGDRLVLSAEDTGMAIVLSYEMDSDFDGQFVVEVLDAHTSELVTSRYFKPRNDGMLILQVPRNGVGREVQLATRFVAPDGSIASRQPFDRTFSAELGKVYTSDYILYIHSYGGTELRSFDRTIGTELPEQLSERLIALDRDFQYFSFVQRQVVGVDRSSPIPTQTVRVSVSTLPQTIDGPTGLPTRIAYDDFQDYLRLAADAGTLELVESLYRVVGAWAIAAKDIPSLAYQDRVRLADWYLPQRDSENYQYYLDWFQVPLILNQEMYDIIAGGITRDEDARTLSMYEAYELPDRTIYLYEGVRFPKVFRYHDTSHYSQEEKAVLADLFSILPDKYRIRGVSFDTIASGFYYFPEEDPDGSSNRIYAHILSALAEAGVSPRTFFSYYTVVEDLVVQEYNGNTYRRPRTSYYLDRNWYRLSEDDLAILSAWRESD